MEAAGCVREGVRGRAVAGTRRARLAVVCSKAMPTLQLRHVAGSEPARFEVQREGGKAAPAAEVPSPVGFPVEGRPMSGHPGRYSASIFVSHASK